MSWSIHLDRIGPMRQGYIVDLKGVLWGEPTNKTPDQKATPEELKDIATHIDDYDYFNATGIRLGGQKFVRLNHEENVLKGKKNQDGLICFKCLTCILIVHGGPDIQINELNMRVGEAGDYLIKTNF